MLHLKEMVASPFAATAVASLHMSFLAGFGFFCHLQRTGREPLGPPQLDTVGDGRARACAQGVHVRRAGDAHILPGTESSRPAWASLFSLKTTGWVGYVSQPLQP